MIGCFFFNYRKISTYLIEGRMIEGCSCKAWKKTQTFHQETNIVPGMIDCTFPGTNRLFWVQFVEPYHLS